MAWYERDFAEGFGTELQTLASHEVAFVCRCEEDIAGV